MSTSYYKRIQHLPYVLGVIILSFIFSGCNIDDDTSIPNRSEIAVSIQFLNADPGSKEEPQKVTIEIYDSNGLVYTPIGKQSSSYSIENGFLSLVIRSGVEKIDTKEKNIDLPYRFTIRSSSDGYLQKTQSIVIDEYQSVYAPVFMMPLKNMPEGSSAAQSSASLTSGAIIDNFTQINTKPSPRSGEKGITANLIIDSDTQLLGAEKKPIRDTTSVVSIDFYQFDPRFEASANAFPNGFLVTDAVDKAGDTLASLNNSFFFSSLGYINLSMNVGIEEVRGFSKPVTLEMEVPSDLINPVTGKPIQADFQVPLWSLNSRTGQWTNEEDITLFEKEGKLYARMEMTHLSTWNLDQKVAACTPPASGTISIDIDNTGQGFKARYAEFYNTSSNMILGPTGNVSNVVLLQSNQIESLSIIRAPNVPSTAGGGLQFKLYNTVRKADGVDKTLNNVACGSTRSLDLSGDPSDCAHFEIYIECSDYANKCFRPNMIGLWYEQGLVTPGVDPDDIEYQEAYYAGVPKNGAIDIDMTDIRNKVGTGVNIYRFLIQFNAGSITTNTHIFDIRFDGVTGNWSNPGIDPSIKTFNELTPPSGSFCSKWYEILLEFDCEFDPAITYPAGCS